ncbi:phosphopantetheine-binding protein [Amycolatopsis nigrescens]|uniref:phosphopantetheine-binding protein n=1 Tax=Amycolatopsis nigrescens TaxID=381445 RepID=UPI00036467B9|nr:phosphopantetheine-binding protein [Amycolatopsis nigrescens]
MTVRPDSTAVFAVLRENIVAVCPEIDEGEIRADRSMRDLGCDSLERLDIVVAALDELELELNPELLTDVRDIGGLVDALVSELDRVTS